MKIKNNKFFTLCFLAGFLLLAFSTCKEEEKTDPCVSTVAADKTIKLNVTIVVKTATGAPKANEFLEIRFERHPCGASAAEVYSTEGNTNAEGKYVCNQVSIILKNTVDDAFVTATAPNLNSSIKYSNRTFHYNDFDDGEIKTIEMVINEGAD